MRVAALGAVVAAAAVALAGATRAATIDFHVFPYCEPGTFCGHASQAALDRYVCEAVQEMNLQWEVTGLSFRPTTKPVDGTSPSPAPKHCVGGADEGALCVADGDCDDGDCENLPAEKNRYYEVRACDSSPAGRALRAQWFKDVAVFESNAISLFVTRKREKCCSGIARTNKDPATLLGMYCTADAGETTFTSGSVWAHEMGHHWGLVHTFCGCGDPADSGGNAPFHDCDASAGEKACEGGTDWGKECASNQDCAAPGVCALDQLPVVADTPGDACKFERLPRACSDADPVKKCSVDADCGPGEGTCSACRKFVCSENTDVDCDEDADCEDSCVCLPGVDEDVEAAIVEGHEWVSGISTLYGLDTLGGVDVGSPHPSYCAGAWRRYAGGQVSEQPDDLTHLLSNAMSYYGCHGPYVRAGQLEPAFTPHQVSRIQAARALVVSRSPAFLSDVCQGAGGDIDHDGVCGAVDNCSGPTVCSSGMNTCQQDADLDGEGDACDLCPAVVGQTGDIDGDCLGDVCDPDMDNDGCLNADDQHPTERMIPVGSAFHESCGFGTETVYGDEGDDSDGDGFPNCADRDDDDDGLCDDDVVVTPDGAGVPDGCTAGEPCDVPSMGCDGPDPCPETDGAIGCQMLGVPNDCQPDWLVCAFGGCVELFAKLTHVVNPSPETDIVFERIEMGNRAIYATPAKGKTVSQTTKAIEEAAQGLGGRVGGGGAALTLAATGALRLEIWSRRSNTRVAIVGEFDASQLQLTGDPTRAAFLALTPGRSPVTGAPLLDIRATWGLGTEAGDRVRDQDGDGTPDGFDGCILAANPLARDADGDGLGNACDADLDGDGVVRQADVDAVRACEGADLSLRRPLVFEPDDEEAANPPATRPDPEAVLLARLCAAADLDDDDRVDASDTARAAAALGSAPGPSGLVGGSVPRPSPAAELAPVCRLGVPVAKPKIVLTGLGGGPGGQRMVVTGQLPFPVTAIDPPETGAQVLVEDLGRGGRAILRLTHQALQIPPAGPACDAKKDGWKRSRSGRRFVYRNASRLLDPPACAHGVERGALRLTLADGRGALAVRFKSREATLEAPLGPLRLTVVPGGEGVGVAGTCGVVEFAAEDCGYNAARTKFTCR